MDRTKRQCAGNRAVSQFARCGFARIELQRCGDEPALGEQLHAERHVTVTGFAPHLNSHPEATDVTWFVPARAIALHFYPSVPVFPASHGCVRLETRRIAQLIQSNSRAGITSVIVDGTWTKPAHQH